ncbi:MAG: hypothetical protein RLZZ628_2360 [Bacteroidota bacterium]|jgi:preprotein translocase subunit YajC
MDRVIALGGIGMLVLVVPIIGIPVLILYLFFSRSEKKEKKTVNNNNNYIPTGCRPDVSGGLLTTVKMINRNDYANITVWLECWNNEEHTIPVNRYIEKTVKVGTKIKIYDAESQRTSYYTVGSADWQIQRQQEGIVL